MNCKLMDNEPKSNQTCLLGNKQKVYINIWPFFPLFSQILKLKSLSTFVSETCSGQNVEGPERPYTFDNFSLQKLVQDFIHMMSELAHTHNLHMKMTPFAHFMFMKLNANSRLEKKVYAQVWCLNLRHTNNHGYIIGYISMPIQPKKPELNTCGYKSRGSFYSC